MIYDFTFSLNSARELNVVQNWIMISCATVVMHIAW
jgi:hypothetical protein